MKYIIKKIAALIITLLVISLFTFLAFQIIPGDSAVTALGTDATKESIEALRKEMGLDANIAVQYGKWISGVVKGDFGTSMQYKMPVAQLIRDRLPVTVWLAVLASLIIILCSIPLGILAAKKENGILDRCITTVSQVGMAIPPFFLGMMITLIFGLILKWFTPGGYVSMEKNFTGFLTFLIFPAIAIALPKIGMVVKFLRNSLLRQMKLDYVKTARSKGQTENEILYRHVLKNALIPVITFIAIITTEVFAGSIMIEQVFNLPGLGRLLVTAIGNRDFQVVQAVILYMAFVVVFINFLVDILYSYLDPRVRSV